jgi:hypothetical protein
MGMGDEDEIDSQWFTLLLQVIGPEVVAVEVGVVWDESKPPKVSDPTGTPRFQVLLEVESIALVVEAEIEEEALVPRVQEDLRAADGIRPIQNPELHEKHFSVRFAFPTNPHMLK